METNEASVQKEPSERKCHGNRKDQRFRRKCRALGMKSNKIDKLLKKRKQANRQSNQAKVHGKNKAQTKTGVTIVNTSSEPMVIVTAPNPHKRKRNDLSQPTTKSILTIPKSTSSISIAQPTLKKTKKKDKHPTHNMPLVKLNGDHINKAYRFCYNLRKMTNLYSTTTSFTIGNLCI